MPLLWGYGKVLLKLLGVIFISITIILGGVFSHKGVNESIDFNYFSKIKIKKLKRMFQSFHLPPVDKEGIIIPLFVVQIESYILSLFVFLYGVINLILDINPLKIVCFICLTQFLMITLLEMCLFIILKQRINHEFMNAGLISLLKEIHTEIDKEILCHCSQCNKIVLESNLKNNIEDLILKISYDKKLYKFTLRKKHLCFLNDFDSFNQSNEESKLNKMLNDLKKYAK